MSFQPTTTVTATLQALDPEAQAFIQTLLQAAQSSMQPNLPSLKSVKPDTYHGLREVSAPTPDAWLFQMKQYLELHKQNLNQAIHFAATFLRGNALLWWRNIASAAPHIWTTLATALTKEFQPIDAI